MSTNEATLTTQEWTPSVNPWLIALAVMLPTFMVILDSSVANVALPHMAGSFSATSNESMWILTSYLVANGIIIPSTAWFCSIFGRKNFLIICTIIFTLASALCGIANSLDLMIFARIIQGLGGGALMPISQSVLLESFPPSKRGISMAIFGIGIILAPVIGPTLGGWITDNYSWHWIFLINIPIGIMAIILSQMFVEDPPYIKSKTIQKIDYIGFISLIIWLITLQVVLDKGQQSDWFGSEWICWTSFVSVSAMIFFIIWELHFKDSIIDLKAFKDRNFIIGATLSTIVSGILYSTLAILPLFLQSLLGYTAYLSGMSITPRGIGSMLSIGLAGYLSNKIDNRIQIAFGFALLAISCLMFGNLNLNITMNNIILPNIICGLALGFVFTPLTILTFQTLRNEQVANATGIFSLLRSIGGSIGVSIVSTMLSRYAQTHQSYMVSHLSPLNPVFQQKINMLNHFLAMHMNPVIAAHKANYFVYVTLLKQSVLWSYIDNFRFYGLISLILIPTAFIFKNVKNVKSENTVIME